MIVNGQHVFTDNVHVTNDRRFGMFYFSEQTQAQFRNVVLTGDWPKTLPDLTQQEFIDLSIDEFDQRRVKLSEDFEFDFTKDTEADFTQQFQQVEGYADRPATCEKTENGLRISLTGPANTSDCLGYCSP